MISDETKELILAQTDIVDLINPHVPLKRSGSQFRGLCPFHNEKSPSFYVTPSMQRFKCFGCGEGGDAISFVMKYRNIPYPEALRELAKKAGVTIEEEAHDPQAEKHRKNRSRVLELHNKAARHLHELLLRSPDAGHARAYLKGRGYGKEMAERWLVGWMPANPREFLAWAKEAGFTGRELCRSGIASLRDDTNPRAGLYLRFRDRLMFPIQNDYGDIIAFSGRQLVEDKKSGKYINSPETEVFKKGRIFFGLDRAKKAMGANSEGFALLCEGQIDVIACHEAGLENSVAGLGTALTHDHARLLKRYTDTVVLCNDGDASGQKAMGKSFMELAAIGMEVRVATLPEEDDPDSYIKANGQEAFRELISKAQGFFDYQIDYAQRNIDLSQPLNKARLANSLATYLKKIDDGVSRDALMTHCATRLGLGLPEFREAISKVREEKNYARKDEEKEAVQPARVYDPSLLMLCQLGLRSIEVQDWLCDQTESLLEMTASLAGHETLGRILGQRPNPQQPASINRFLGDLPEADAKALTDAMEQTLPDEAVEHATKTLNFLARRSLQARLSQISSQIKSSTLSLTETQALLNETNHLREMLHGSKSL